MNTLHLIEYGSFWGSVFGAVFCLATLILGRINAEMLLNDYPPDIRSQFGAMSAKTRRQASLASFPLLVVLSAVVVIALIQLRQALGELSFVSTFIATTLMFQTWNLMDLLILDWFVLMTLRPSFMILPGTEGLAGYRDYRFHFQKFLKGIVSTLMLSGMVTAFAIGAEALL